MPSNKKSAESAAQDAADAASAARTLVAQYGEDAEVVAMLRAAEYAAAFDRDAHRHWEAILAEVGRLLGEGAHAAGGGSAAH